MQDGYAAPRATVDDGERERRSWRNAAIAAVTGFAAEAALVAYGMSVVGDGIGALRIDAELLYLVVPALLVALVALHLPRLRGLLVAALAPVATVVTMFLLLAISVALFGV